MFASLNIRPCRILIIDEILCVLFFCSRFLALHIQQTHQYALYLRATTKMGRIPTQKISHFGIFMLVSLISQNNRRKGKKERKIRTATRRFF